MNRHFHLSGLLLVSSIRLASADLIYGNITNGTAEHESMGVYWNYNNGAPQFPLGRATAARFSVPLGLDYRLDSVAVGVSQQGLATNLMISLRLDLAGKPGAILETIAIDPMRFGDPVRPGPTSFASSLTPILNGGGSYWLVLEPRSLSLADNTQNAFYSWHVNYQYEQGDLGFRSTDPITGEWGEWNVYNNYLPAFNIVGSAVPEPGTWALLGLGGLAFWSLARRRSHP